MNERILFCIDEVKVNTHKTWIIKFGANGYNLVLIFSNRLTIKLRQEHYKIISMDCLMSNVNIRYFSR